MVLVLLVALMSGAGAGVAAAAAADKGVARLASADGKDVGTVELVETLAGVMMTVTLKGVTPGIHGFHVMEFGKCEGTFASAGNILNPLAAKHGLLSDEGPAMGDLPNLHVPASGELVVEFLGPFVTLAPDGDGSLIREGGTSFIIHEMADDHKTHPDGNSGARMACGVVKLAQ